MYVYERVSVHELCVCEWVREWLCESISVCEFVYVCESIHSDYVCECVRAYRWEGEGEGEMEMMKQGREGGRVTRFYQQHIPCFSMNNPIVFSKTGKLTTESDLVKNWQKWKVFDFDTASLTKVGSNHFLLKPSDIKCCLKYLLLM